MNTESRTINLKDVDEPPTYAELRLGPLGYRRIASLDKNHELMRIMLEGPDGDRPIFNCNSLVAGSNWPDDACPIHAGPSEYSVEVEVMVEHASFF